MTPPATDGDPLPPPPGAGAPSAVAAADGAADRVPFTLGDGATLVLWTFLAQMVIGLLIAPLQLVGLDFEDPVFLAATSVAGSLVTLAGALGWLQLRDRLDWELIGSALPAPRHLLQGVGTGLVGLVVVFGYQYVVDQLLGGVPPPQQSILELIRSGGPVAVVLAIVVAVALAPVVEEVVFRGVLFQAMRRRWRLWVAVTASAVVFALAHVELYLPPFANPPSPTGLGGLVLLAAWFAGVFVWSRSLIVPAVGHAVFNGTVIVLAVLTG